MTDQIIALRHRLHEAAEISGSEHITAALVMEFLKSEGINSIIQFKFSTSFMAVIQGPPIEKEPNRNIVLRCELDALPIEEKGDFPWISKGHASHKCGHDGHMASVISAGLQFRDEPISGVNCILLFQAAEETGMGAPSVITEEAFTNFKFAAIIAYHNLPGYPAQKVVFKPSQFAATSCGLKVFYTGRTSHASEPQLGNSPSGAIMSLVQHLDSLPQKSSALDENLKVTVVHFYCGKEAFGTAPADGAVFATFRAYDDDVLKKNLQNATEMALKLGEVHNLECRVETTEYFPATINDPELSEKFLSYLEYTQNSPLIPEKPFSWSEDFGNYRKIAPSLFFGVGSGIDCPSLHNPDYDFPDSLIEYSGDILYGLVKYMS